MIEPKTNRGRNNNKRRHSNEHLTEFHALMPQRLRLPRHSKLGFATSDPSLRQTSSVKSGTLLCMNNSARTPDSNLSGVYCTLFSLICCDDSHFFILSPSADI